MMSAVAGSNRPPTSASAPAPIHVSTSLIGITTTPLNSPRRRAAANVENRGSDHRRGSSSPLTREPPHCETTPVSRSTSFAWSHDLIHSQAYDKTNRRFVQNIMGRKGDELTEEKDSLLKNGESSAAHSRNSEDSTTTASSTSLVLENLNRIPAIGKPSEPLEYRDDDSDTEIPRWKEQHGGEAGKTMSRRLKVVIWIVSFIALAGWTMALVSFLLSGRYQHSSTKPYDHESPTKSSGKKITMNHVQQGYFSPSFKSLNWVHGANGEDGLLLEVAQAKKDFLVVEDVRSRKGDPNAYPSKTLLKSGWQDLGSKQVYAEDYWPSPDLKKVLIVTERKQVYRHSFTGLYYVVDVETQRVEPLDPENPDARVQLAKWAPTSDSIVFTRENNMYLRLLSSTAVRQITEDGGPEYFYGIPDWAYEEEVFQTNVATWWARDGQYIAFMRTNETMVPEYPVQFFMTRPNTVESGLENYPETTKIKYPKAGAPNPVVEMLFYDVARNEVFRTEVGGGFADDDRLIADVLWADDGHCMVRELNRVSDHIRMVLVDVGQRTGKVVRTENRKELDGGWIEPGQGAFYVPADPAKGRPQDGYVDMVIDGDNHHLAYFTPMDNPTPLMLTSGAWDVEHGTFDSIDLDHNMVYFVAAKEHPTTRHIYSVDLGGREIKPLVPVDKPAYYGVKFSAKAGYALIVNSGPGVPTQEVISTSSNPISYNEMLSDNQALGKLAASFQLAHKVWTNITVDGFTLQVLERRPPHFDPTKQYPVLFQQYSGPGSQSVHRKFEVDFQTYVASTLEYIVVTVDGRGTGYIGRKAMCITRGELGKYEAADQIAAAKLWAQKPYVDANRIAIWGWSFGGFTTLKTLEQDGGQTFKYGMAVAPVTDWRFYDSIYTERYMYKPQDNQDGFERSAITNVSSLAQNVRFLVMHGTGDDNVHVQNTLSLIDKLDMAGISNYDVHVFPDSNHNIGFHRANQIVYEKLEKWLISAFNGAWYKYENPVPE